METNQPNPIMIGLKKIWPTIYQVINGTIYFLLNLVKTIVKLCIEQVKGSF